MRTMDELHQLAERCRRMAADVHDDLVAKGLIDLADQYEILAISPPCPANGNDAGD